MAPHEDPNAVAGRPIAVPSPATRQASSRRGSAQAPRNRRVGSLARVVGLGQKGRMPVLTAEGRPTLFVSETTRSRLNTILDDLAAADDLDICGRGATVAIQTL